MTIAIVGRKCGMTRIFTEDGSAVPVTVIETQPNRITQIKSDDVDGYSAVQVTIGERRASRVNRAAAGHFAKAGVEAGRRVREVPFEPIDGQEPVLGGELNASLFSAGDLVDVTGQSKGKGFQGGIKRWNFSCQDATHGNSLSHRSNGSIGQNQTPGRVFKGKKMSGHMGAVQVTVQSLEVVRVEAERNLVLVKGAVPGATGGDVVIRSAVKAKKS